MIYEDYITYTREYRALYPRALVLMEVGSFWELYNCDADLGAPVEAVCDLCNMQYTRKDKKFPLSGKNPMMAGFPSVALRKFLPVLVGDGYTVVLVSQVSPPPNPRRAVTDVISSATLAANDLGDGGRGDPHLVSLFLETVQDWKTKKPVLMIGVALLDLSTGSVRIAECMSRPSDYAHAYDALYRLLAGVAPAEVVVHSVDAVDLTSLTSRLEIECIVHDRCGPKFEKAIANVKYQNDTLRRVFACLSMLSPLEELDMERAPVAAGALVGAIRFVEHHNTSLLQHIKRPIDANTSTSCELCFNTAKQLHVYSRDAKEKTLEKVSNRCSTAMGRRYFVRRLLSPFAKKTDIDLSLGRIDGLVADPAKVQALRSVLRRVCDLERLFHKIELGRCQHTSMLMIMESVRALDEVGVSGALHVFLSETFDGAATCEGDLFREGVYADVDEARDRVRVAKDALQGFVDLLNRHTNDGFFKMEHNDREGHYIVGTAKRWKDADLKGVNYMGVELCALKAVPVSSNSTSVKLTHSKLKELSGECTATQTFLSTVFAERWSAMQTRMALDFKTEFTRLVQQASELDFDTTCALNAHEYGYSRPRIVDSSASSFVRCKGLRHALLERVHDQVRYVENDVEIGAGTTHSGFLLYGLNSAGKSSLMKALGLCVIMAQAGMYVPCTDYESAPYTRVFTRITRGDDMLRGQSTFTVEMTEMRNILKRSDANSLVVGDEICAGTESVSGASLVAAGVLQLLERGTSFVLTTHLHGLMELDVLRRQERLGVYHLAVHYDDTTGVLVYDRKLAPGSGSSVYGLEVCRSLDMDPAFLALADEIRLTIQDKHKLRASTFNASVTVDKCSLCGKPAEEVHHIAPQAIANAAGMIGTFHKNAAHNLVCLCASCHDSVHAGKLRIDGYQHTSKGVELKVAKASSPSQLSSGIEELVRNKRSDGSSFTNIQRHVQATHGIRLSTYMIKKLVAHVE